MNTLRINGYNTVVAYDEEIDMFRGEFVGLNGGADFYASDISRCCSGGIRSGSSSYQADLC